MSGQVGKTNAASNTTKTTNAPAKKAEQKKQAKQPVPVGGNSKAKKTELKEPKKPTPVIKTITPQEVGKVSLGGICDKFNINTFSTPLKTIPDDMKINCFTPCSFAHFATSIVKPVFTFL